MSFLGFGIRVNVGSCKAISEVFLLLFLKDLRRIGIYFPNLLEFTRKTSYTELQFDRRFVITESITLPITDWFRFSISSWRGLIKFYVSRNVSILFYPTFWHIFVYNGLLQYLALCSISSMFPTSFLIVFIWFFCQFCFLFKTPNLSFVDLFYCFSTLFFTSALYFISFLQLTLGLNVFLIC